MLINTMTLKEFNLILSLKNTYKQENKTLSKNSEIIENFILKKPTNDKNWPFHILSYINLV